MGTGHRRGDLEANSMPIKELANVNGRMNKGDMFFEGDGAVFTASFRDRIHHILEANGAFYAGNKKRGHAQKNQNISFNTIQPYPEGEQVRGVPHDYHSPLARAKPHRLPPMTTDLPKPFGRSALFPAPEFRWGENEFLQRPERILAAAGGDKPRPFCALVLSGVGFTPAPSWIGYV